VDTTGAGWKRPVRAGSGPLKEDTSATKPLMQGPVWQLNPDMPSEDASQWVLCDMWLANDGNLCYYCLQEGKRLVYMGREELLNSTIVAEPSAKTPRGCGLDIREGPNIVRLALVGAQAHDQWTSALTSFIKSPTRPPKAAMANKKNVITPLHMTCRNRRQPVPRASRRDYEPVFRAVLWKREPHLSGPWVAREMWISVNFNLVYYSVKEDRDLIYYTAQDLSRATIVRVPNGSNGSMPWIFQVVIPPQGGVEFAPGEFAAVSDEARESWIQEFSLQQVRRSGRLQVRNSLLRGLPDGGRSLLADAIKGDYEKLIELHDQAPARKSSGNEPEAEPFYDGADLSEAEQEPASEDPVAASKKKKKSMAKGQAKPKGKANKAPKDKPTTGGDDAAPKDIRKTNTQVGGEAAAKAESAAKKKSVTKPRTEKSVNQGQNRA